MAVAGNDYRERWSPLWEDPEDVASSAAPSILSPAQVQQWKDEGWLVVTGIWPDALIEEARQACEAAWPDGAEGPARRFPFAEETHAMNRVTMSPRYHAVVRQLLADEQEDEPPILLTWSHCLAKHGALGAGGGATGTLGEESFGTRAQPFHQ